jgi:hypothetical protein
MVMKWIAIESKWAANEVDLVQSVKVGQSQAPIRSAILTPQSVTNTKEAHP